jgi:Fur family transcriptional regulator, peroxide stress response regulator
LPLAAVEVYSPAVNETPQDVTASPRRKGSPRRKRSQQRERMLAWLRATDTHPTAAQIHDHLAPEMPSLSLATVYRNLEVLVADGEIDEVPSGVGAARYDGNVEPHHHFNCGGCGRIVDVDVPVPRGLLRRLEGDHGLVSTRVRMSFFGFCGSCERQESTD